MSKLPVFEGLAIFAKVLQMQSFARAAAELQLLKATVSKAVGRLEAKFGVRLFNPTSRRLSPTEAGRQLAERAAHMLAQGELAESEGTASAAAPRGHVRLAAPMSFGVLKVAPILPEFFDRYPEVSIDLHLSDAHIDLIGEGYDAAIRIAALPDSSLVGRTLVAMRTRKRARREDASRTARGLKLPSRTGNGFSSSPTWTRRLQQTQWRLSSPPSASWPGWSCLLFWRPSCRSWQPGES